MADNSGGPSAVLGVIVGALIVVGIAVFFFGGFGGRTSGPSVSVNVPSPTAPAR
jgi:hypothetical protein